MGCSYRFNRLFNVTKTRALVVAVLFFIAGVCVIPIGIALAADPAGGLASLYPFAVSLIYGCIWCYKFCRDKKIIQQAQAPRQVAAEQPVPINNPDSYQLFIPGRRQEM